MKFKTFQTGIAEYIREIVFGLEDSLVSTLGAIIGIAVGSQSKFIVILSGLVILAAESTSMAAGSYLSSKSAMETEINVHHAKGESHSHSHKINPIRGGIVMWVFYIVGGFVPLFPFFVLDVNSAVILSIFVTAFSLFMLGFWTSRFTKQSPVKSGIGMMSISLVAAFIGYVVGYLVSHYYGVLLPV